MCEFVLTIDKIKHPKELRDLHSIVTSYVSKDNTSVLPYHDLSLGLIGEGHIGWMEMLRNFELTNNLSVSSVSVDVIKESTERNARIAARATATSTRSRSTLLPRHRNFSESFSKSHSISEVNRVKDILPPSPLHNRFHYHHG